MPRDVGVGQHARAAVGDDVRDGHRDLGLRRGDGRRRRPDGRDAADRGTGR